MSNDNASSSGQWYFDTRTQSVAEEPGPDRLGPYPTRDEAASAMRIVDARNKRWSEDPRWNDDADEA
ncbi:hypothetical protein ACIRBY_15920 [Streptomyces sp. NPDC096136]|uniref:hypothetical protein n=1 Tax=Streptomyces sp. NPDC096136 TaxID=3366076 RepID=UPI003807E0C6